MSSNNNFDIDNLKESWKKQESSIHYSQQDLVSMLNKRSINNVKYLVIISIFELVVLCFSLVAFTTNENIIDNLEPVTQAVYLTRFKISQSLIFLNILLAFGFIYYFIKYYKKINVQSSAKDFIDNIIRFRRSISWFIFINIFFGLIYLYLTGFYDIMANLRITLNDKLSIQIDKIHTLPYSPQYILIFMLILLFLLAIVTTYYFIIYGLLIKRLNRNLKELKKLDS